jgi:hypothetical protein
MCQKVHVLNRITRQIETAILTTEHSANSYGQPVIVLEDAQSVDAWQYEVLPFPMADESCSAGDGEGCAH